MLSPVKLKSMLHVRSPHVSIALTLLGSTLVHATRQQPASCGSRYLPYIREFSGGSFPPKHSMPMRRCLHRFLGGIWSRAAVEAASGGGQRNGQDLLCRTIQQHSSSTCFSASTENLVVLEVVREPHWCDLVFCSRLQQIITSVGLPLWAVGCHQTI